MSSNTTFQLPDLFKDWPLPRTINPHHEEIASISADWIDSYKAFSPRRRIAFRKAAFGLLASLACPLANREHLRAGCDLMNVVFVFDDISDEQCESDVRKESDLIMDALRYTSFCRSRSPVF
jgi:hypothetical protein